MTVCWGEASFNTCAEAQEKELGVHAFVVWVPVPIVPLFS